MSETITKVWNTCGYVRLSREDGDKEESNSVTGQKDLIRNFLHHHPELQERGMKVDDGYTGSNFNRPAFQEMLADVKAGKFNCIVVKDLSRFGREYLDAGEYIERIFPFLGVRFIAINDNYDSLHHNDGSDDLIIPFKNLINEAYCRDTSVKIRSQLEIKRQRGDFIGPFATFGYQKDPDDHHKLLIDEYAANVVRDMFMWKLSGVSSCDIADRLTKAGIPTPMDYKRSLGMRYKTSFRVKAESVWSANMVLRILKNPIYIGTLEQGRVTTPNYKIKRLVYKPREEWAVVEGCHEPVIDSDIFEIVQKVLALDTRTSPGGEGVELFSGLVYCGECGGAMIRKTVPSGKKKYVYYVCATHKKQPAVCYSHNLRDTQLNEKYCGDALLQKTFIQDCISKKVIRNTGQLPQYLIQNCHQGIVSRQIYDSVQAEMARRNAGKSPSKKNAPTDRTSYASRYALSERLVCGECGTLYRRCVWAKRGRRRVVWRCVSRLDYGTKYCRHSPTLDEEPLQKAILAAINKAMGSRDEMSNQITEAIEMELASIPGQTASLTDIQCRLGELEGQFNRLLEQAAEQMGSQDHMVQFQSITNEIAALKEQREQIEEQKRSGVAAVQKMTTTIYLMEKMSPELTEWDESWVRQLVDTVKVLSEYAYLRGGLEIRQSIKKHKEVKIFICLSIQLY